MAEGWTPGQKASFKEEQAEAKASNRSAHPQYVLCYSGDEDERNTPQESTDVTDSHRIMRDSQRMTRYSHPTTRDSHRTMRESHRMMRDSHRLSYFGTV